jgi:hypothetical protein
MLRKPKADQVIAKIMQSSGGSLNCEPFTEDIGHLIWESKVNFISIYLITLSTAHTANKQMIGRHFQGHGRQRLWLY